MVVGVPDGIGAYLPDDSTVRVVVQSESYGPIKDGEAYPYTVNDGVTFTGSHVQYADYNRKKLAQYMSSEFPTCISLLCIHWCHIHCVYVSYNQCSTLLLPLIC